MIMLPERLISEDEFFLKQHKPLIGILLSGKLLLSSSGRVDVIISGKGRQNRCDILHYHSDE